VKALARRKLDPILALRPHRIPKADLRAVQAIYDKVENREQRYELNLYIAGVEEGDQAPTVASAPDGGTHSAPGPEGAAPGTDTSGPRTTAGGNTGEQATTADSGEADAAPGGDAGDGSVDATSADADAGEADAAPGGDAGDGSVDATSADADAGEADAAPGGDAGGEELAG
jgi:hypothetical protein